MWQRFLNVYNLLGVSSLSQHHCELGFIIPLVQTRKLRQREAHTVRKPLSYDPRGSHTTDSALNHCARHGHQAPELG